MKPPQFDYTAPESVEEVVALLHGHEEAKLLAGGQSLVPLLNFRLATPSLLIDLRRAAGLDGVERSDGHVRIGAMLTQRAAEESADLAEDVPLLREALSHVSHPQIRARGTVGGSLAHADPAAELPAVLVALDGRVKASSVRGERWVEAADLYRGYFTTSLERDEVVTAVELPAARPRTGTACVEIAQRPGDYALCGAVVQVTVTEAGETDDVRVALFGVGQRPVRARGVESLLNGAPSAELVSAASAHAADDLIPPDDSRASSDYRMHLARVLVRRALERALERAA